MAMLTLDDFLSHLESDLTWRKKEISSLLFLEDNKNSLLIAKSCILLMYSHWEGYIKNACKQYLIHISDMNQKLSDLTLNFEAIALKGIASQTLASSKTLNLVNEINLMEAIYNNGSKLFKVPGNLRREKNKDFINTCDNLNLSVLNSFFKIVGIGEVSLITGREKFIDEKLLNQRNAISHGTKINLQSAEFNLEINEIKSLRDFIILLMEYVKDELSYYSENELYLQKNHKIATTRYTKRISELEKEMKDVFDASPFS